MTVVIPTKNKSSLRRHINTVHLNQRFICGHCHKSYMRNIDFLKHRIHCHQPVILQQGPDNIERVAQKPTTSNPSVNIMNNSPTTRFDIHTTTKTLEGKTNWEQILRRDLALSDDDSPQLISRSTLTDQTQNPDISRSCNTSPIGIVYI